MPITQHISSMVSMIMPNRTELNSPSILSSIDSLRFDAALTCASAPVEACASVEIPDSLVDIILPEKGLEKRLLRQMAYQPQPNCATRF
jgi:hypothetical protein